MKSGDSSKLFCFFLHPGEKTTYHSLTKHLMKHTYLLLLLMASGLCASAQYGKRFHLAVGAGFNTSTDLMPYGYLIYLEPSYRVNENLSIGVRTESLSRKDSYVDVMGSYTAFVKYYITREEPRFAAGMGWGLYTPNQSLLIPSSIKDKYITLSGFHPRIGWEAEHFELILEYNILPDLSMPYYNSSGSQAMQKINTSYLALKFGLRIGI
jgi:hypothetical protein